MSGFGRRVRHERDLWKAVWQQIDTFLDRIDGCADQDEAHAVTLCELMPVLNVIESARKRALGYGLRPAPPAAPRGVGLTMTLDAIKPDPERLPGVEECEFAAAPIYVDKDDNKHLFLWPTEVLSSFRDSKRFLIGDWLVPAYDTGRIDNVGGLFPFIDIGDVADDGLFPWDVREDAANGEDFEFEKWSKLRQDRLDDLDPTPVAGSEPISAALSALDPYTASLADFQAVGARAAAAAASCEADRAVLDHARTELAEVGTDDALLGALAACIDQLALQVTRYTYVAGQLTTRTLTDIRAQYADLVAAALTADFAGGGVGMSPTMIALDGAATAVFDKEVEARIAYPDGPLRQLRMLEQGLRHFWKMRRQWMKRRSDLFTNLLVFAFWQSFIDSVNEVVAGRWSQLTLPGGTRTTRVINARATTVYVTGIPPMDSFRPGRLARIGGDRPALAVVVDEGFDKNGLFLTTAAIELSVATTQGLAGLPGLVPEGTAITTSFGTFSDAEYRRGVAGDPSRDALLTGLIAHVSKLRLVLGAGGGSRPAAPSVPVPYPGIPSFALDGPVAPEAARLFLSAVPSAAASGTGEVLGVGRPGELMLVRGIDDEGLCWQGVAEIDSCAVMTGAEARKDDQITATPVPPCCEDDQPVMIVTLRQLQLPATLTRDVTLRRDFLGFGTRSLLSAAILPGALDTDTSVPSVTVDGASTLVLRDHELKAAVKLFEDWIGRDTGAGS